MDAGLWRALSSFLRFELFELSPKRLHAYI